MNNRQEGFPSPRDARPDRQARVLAELRAAVRLLARTEGERDYPEHRIRLLAALDGAIGALEGYHRDGGRQGGHLDRALRDLAGRRQVYELMAGAPGGTTDMGLRGMLEGWIREITEQIRENEDAEETPPDPSRETRAR